MPEYTKHSNTVVIAGATSILGAALARRQTGLHRVPVCNTHIRAKGCADWHRIDMEDLDGWKRLLDEVEPTHWIQGAGVCNVGQCEKYPEWARKINVDSLNDLLSLLPASVRLIYISSDHVFGGRDAPYSEFDAPEPITYYGRLRVQAEDVVQAHRPDALILRPGLCLGPSMDGRRGHWDNLPRRIQQGLEVSVMDGEERSTFWADTAAERVEALLDTDESGMWHFSSDRSTGRVELARAICESRDLPQKFRIQPIDLLSQPHLGKVELISHHDHPLAKPLPSLIDHLALTD